jgi:SOS-response transcriptional repressor LexA
MIGLTPRQLDALRFIARFQAERGFSPSRREIAEGLGLRSKASSARLLTGLAERGAIRTLRCRTRAIEVLIPVSGSDGCGTRGFGLTQRQQDALRFITGYIERNGIPPSKREIADGIATARESTSYIQRILLALRASGAIALDDGQHRGITLLRPVAIPRAPDGAPLHFVRIGESALPDRTDCAGSPRCGREHRPDRARDRFSPGDGAEHDPALRRQSRAGRAARRAVAQPDRAARRAGAAIGRAPLMPGMTPGEQAVLSRFELGQTAAEIAADLNIPRRRAERLIQMYDADPAHDHHREALIRRGSQTLLAKIRKAGGHR